MSPLLEEMPGRAEELSTLFEKRNRRGEPYSPVGVLLLSQAYGLPAPLEEEPKCLLS